MFKFDNMVRGFTLLEVMLSLVLGLFLLTGLYQILQIASQTDHIIQGNLTMQANAQQVNDWFRRELSQAGYAGCRHLGRDFTVLNHLNITDPFVIKGYSASVLS